MGLSLVPLFYRSPCGLQSPPPHIHTPRNRAPEGDNSGNVVLLCVLTQWCRCPEPVALLMYFQAQEGEMSVSKPSEFLKSCTKAPKIPLGHTTTGGYSGAIF